LGAPAQAAEAYARADALAPLDPPLLANRAESEVRQIQPESAPSPGVVAVLKRLGAAEPNNASRSSVSAAPPSLMATRPTPRGHPTRRSERC
jgi:hypothetical protein